MSAETLKFPPWIQEPMEQGWLTPASAWMLEMELTELVRQPWSPGMWDLYQLVQQFHVKQAGTQEEMTPLQ